MAVFHYHGRKTKAVASSSCAPTWWPMVQWCAMRQIPFQAPQSLPARLLGYQKLRRELLSGSNTFLPEIGFSHRLKVACALAGAVKYWVKAPLAARRTPDFQ
jgi:hypothetical protein